MLHHRTPSRHGRTVVERVLEVDLDERVAYRAVAVDLDIALGSLDHLGLGLLWRK